MSQHFDVARTGRARLRRAHRLTSIRRATTADLPAIRQLITDAYEKYIERIGRPPAPMTADYTAALEHSRVWVLVSDDAVVGALVTEHRGDHLLLETIAVSARRSGTTVTAGCCSTAPKVMRPNSG